MNTVTLKTDGQMIEDGRKAADPLTCLGCRIELEEGYILRSFFCLFSVYPELVRISPFLPASIQQFGKSPKTDCTWDGCRYLELSKTVEMIGFPGPPKLEIYFSFQGVQDKDTKEIRYVPLENLLDMPVKLGPLKHIVFGDKVDAFQFDTHYTLFEFIDGIVWELSFHGTPARCEIRR